ncbi:hypothetical protein D915_000289 [Fasciola hepatica]|uniref:Fibronectin type III domain protein n=1 Tax=Fasciola hepatica TaxID=6192 RepID=A0A4E0RLL6_FASHE|nr:hypothetical protein D915_000289 [Fasciola hepatica]
MGHLTLHSEDSKVMDLEALPYRDGTIIVFWNFVFRCSNSVAELRLWIDHETYEQKLDISQKFTVLKTPPIMDLGKHFTVGIILSQLDHGYVLANTSKTFLHERDPSVKWFESDAWEDRITVAWQKRSVPGERLLGVWREGKSYGYKLLSNGITEVTMESPDYCEDHELSLIGWYPSGKRVFLGQTQINTNWEKEQQTNLFPAKNGLLVHWKHFSLCEYTTYAVHVNGNGFTYSRKWAYKTDDNLFVSTLEDIEEVNVTYTALHSTDWSQQFSVHYHLKKINVSLKVKNIHYETDGMSIALEWPPMDPTELEFITFDQDMNVDIVRRHSTNTGPITMNFATCKPFELMMIQITGDNTKVLLGSVKIDAGEIRISGEKTSNEKVVLSYVTKHCHPDHVYIHVGHPLNPHLPNGSVSSGFVELTELEPCVIYDVQLIAFYEPSYFSVSEMIRTALAPGLNESVPKVTIMNNNLVINWKPRAKCHLESASITVLKDSIIWKKLNVTNAIQETILQVPSVKAVYAVSIEFTYFGQFVERSDYAVVNYEPESYPQLKLEVQVQPRSVHLSWDSPKSYSPLYYRLDGLYNNGEEFITVVLDQECVLPILRTMEYLNVIVSAVSVQGIRQVSGQITVWPTKVPQKPAPPVIEKKDHALYIYWKLNSTNPVDHLRIFVKSDRETWKREIQNPRPVGGFELKNTSCLTTACVITLQGVNRFGGSLISEPKSFHPISTIR